MGGGGFGSVGWDGARLSSHGQEGRERHIGFCNLFKRSCTVGEKCENVSEIIKF